LFGFIHMHNVNSIILEIKTDIFLPQILTQPILDWVLDRNNRKLCLTITPPHLSGFVVGMTHLESMKGDLKKLNFPISELNKINTYILKELGWKKKDLKPEVRFGSLISYSEKGHVVHLHKDKNELEGYIHVRLNVMISLPQRGGHPQIDGSVIEMKENQVWVCRAGDFFHSTTEVEGEKPRIMLSMGYNVPLYIPDRYQENF